MKFELTEQLQDYLEARGKIVLNACPGSGKTTAIAKKMILLQDEYKSKFGRFSGIACLSFTNTAKDEINEKYTELSGDYLDFPHKVSTIDSFINQFITLPFYYLLNSNFKRPKIIDDKKILDSMWEIKYTDPQGKIRDGLKTSLLKFKAKDGRNIFYTYPPSVIRREIDGSFSIGGKSPASDKVDLNVFNAYAAYLFKTRLTKEIISTQDSAYIANHLLSKCSRIGEILNLRFPHIIVDEAQDNSALQYALFDKLIEHGLANIEFIGDPYQSLYEWRDADPKLFNEKYKNTNWHGLNLTDNRRSPQRIIDCFSLLRKSDDPSLNTACTEDKEIPVFIYRYSSTNTPFVLQHFDNLCQSNRLNNNQIVVRGNKLRNKMLGKQVDQVPWKSELAYRIIEARQKYEGNEIKEAIKIMRSISVSLIGHGKEYIEIKELEQELKTDNHFNAKLLNILHDMPNFKLTISDWTIQTQIFIKDRLGLSFNVDFELKKRNSNYFNKSILIEPLDQHFKCSYSENKIPITTVHQVKGKSLDSILVFFNENKNKDNITFSDIITSVQNFPSEKQRIIYVALSRPRHLLAMAFPESISVEEIKNKFGKNVLIIDNEQLKIYSRTANI